jgi:GDPmannose 4,6-dehydratase
MPSADIKKALITGITGQDGSYLAEFLLGKGYQVHGIVRRSSSFNTDRIEHLYADRHDPDIRLFLHYGDLVDGIGLREILTRVKPHEVYNLGAQSHVRVSFDQPVYTVAADALGTMNILEAVRDASLPTRFYQASSSEMYGKVLEPIQTETTPFYPRSPYACAKVYAYWQTVNYREAYGMFACNGIMFNHESPRRGETFVTRKITRAATRIKEGLQEKIFLGNLDARRDWGFAGDYVEAMWLMLQQPAPEDFIIATGESHSLRDFVEAAFRGIGRESSEFLVQDGSLLRPTEIKYSYANVRKIEQKIGWSAQNKMADVVRLMLAADATAHSNSTVNQ